ncbi:hypothetical protein [Actinomadura macrotermitis]|uniref:Uncharacterized protein n=1 Tax=Actinomadura macrotermitis TaxID=2585200 RepID=A0A7K0BUG7_9ACTN|nr:hypothetical protein [Actinomadura macrotermitis]MQY04850.1 hypothetical protein [Actinomadura macrotermitis]
MAHFMVLVLVDKDAADPATAAEEMMTPYFGENGKTDGYVIGGRYDGVVRGQEQQFSLPPADFQRRYGLDVVRPEDNIVPVTALPEPVLPFAVVTPDGAWHERGADQEEGGWQAEFRRLIAAHPDTVAVTIDCHC